MCGLDRNGYQGSNSGVESPEGNDAAGDATAGDAAGDATGDAAEIEALGDEKSAAS